MHHVLADSGQLIGQIKVELCDDFFVTFHFYLLCICGASFSLRIFFRPS
jgi:hypothetical protein